MRCYLFNAHEVTVCATAPEACPEGAVLVQSNKELDAKRFPLPRLVAIWNSLPGATPVKRFNDRKSAIRRLWSALEALPLPGTRADSKQAKLIDLLSRPTGAGLDELMTATGWQAHSVRGVLSGVLRKKLGLNVVSIKDGNGRVYRIER